MLKVEKGNEENISRRERKGYLLDAGESIFLKKKKVLPSSGLVISFFASFLRLQGGAVW